MRWIKHIGLLGVVCILLGNCTSKINFTQYSHVESGLRTTGTGQSDQKCCRLSESYAPNNADNNKLRVVFHFMYDSLGQNNLPKEEARAYAHSLIEWCNKFLYAEEFPSLYEGPDTSAFSKGYSYEITPSTNDPDDDGIYFHNDQALYAFVAYGKNTNNYNREVIRKYQTSSDSFLNIFMMPHHPDSVLSPTYKARRNGIALGYSVKVSGYFSNKHGADAFCGLVNHEIGHILGLSHTWNSNDGCDDTPKHSNCWIKSEEPPCDSAYSNNMMDYNAWQNALTPCQISRIKRNLTRWNSRQRHLVIPSWCNLQDTIFIRDSVVWEGERDLNSDVIIENGGTLHIKCRTSMPKNAQFLVMPEGQLILDHCWLHNSCGEEWEGIRIGDNGKTYGSVKILGEVSIENVKLTKDGRLD